MKSSFFLVLVGSALTLSAALPRSIVADPAVALNARGQVCPAGRSGYNCEIIDTKVKRTGSDGVCPDGRSGYNCEIIDTKVKRSGFGPETCPGCDEVIEVIEKKDTLDTDACPGC